MNTHAACLCLGPANALTQRQSKMLVKFENNVHEAVPVTTRAKPESEPHGYPRYQPHESISSSNKAKKNKKNCR